ncbi:oligosaccharide flippase family protein [Sphingobacteriaceae bacterium AH-315-L07]|nr:oligosaccharide flippase family protein [Sphingobacteriaceae bacterium AH-315-L07]
MHYLKKLAGQTAVYGLSSVVGRVLNYFVLTPLYTRILSTEQYGIVTDIYAYVAFLIILFTYGMETGYFRFSELEKDRSKVYSTTLISILLTSVAFVTLMIFNCQSIADWLMYPQHTEYIILFAIIVGADAVVAIPFARLRQQNKARYFATVKIINILVNISLNIFFFVICPWIINSPSMHEYHAFINSFYDPDTHVGYVFISNLAASLVTFILLIPNMSNTKWGFDTGLLKRMILYTLPLMIAGLAGMTNQHLDKILLKYLLPFENIGLALDQLGVYGACYKLSIIITLLIQAFGMAAEPFYFAQAKEKNAKDVYANIMKYFVIVISFIFLSIMMYMDVIKFFIGENFHGGLDIVPILLIANICFGIYYNLSIWFKLSGKTLYGAYISIGGAIITIVLNVILIPIIGYWGSTWATLICFAFMMVVCYYLGQAHYAINYNVKRILGYFFLAIILFMISKHINIHLQIENIALKLLFNSLFVAIYIGVVLYIEKLKKVVISPDNGDQGN